MSGLGAPLAFPLGGEGTPTSAALTEDDAHVAYCLVFEGYNLILTDHHDTEGLADAWDAVSEWSNVLSGLDPVGTIRQSAQPFDAKVGMPSMSFSYVDPDEDDAVAALMLREANDEAPRSQFIDNVIANMDAETDYVLLSAVDVADFPESGTVHIGSEEIAYAGKAAGLLTPLTRGVRSLFGTSTDPEHFGQSHRLDIGTDFRPEASTAPLRWIGRKVKLYLCVEEDDVWTAGAAAECIWAGTIRTISDEGTGRVHLECDSILKKLEGKLLRKQYRGYLEEGYYLTAANHGRFEVRVRMGNVDSAGVTSGWDPPVSATTAALLPADDRYTAAEIATLINDQLDDWFDGTPFSTDWDLNLDLVEGRYQWTFEYSGAAPAAGDAWQWVIEIKMSRYLAYMLGYQISWQTLIEINSGVVISEDTPFQWARTVPNYPRRVAMPTATDVGTIITVGTVISGQIEEQPTIPPGVEPDTTLFLKIAGKVVIGVKPTGTPNAFAFRGYLPEDYTLGLTPVATSTIPDSDDIPDSLEELISTSITDEGVLVEQVWFEIGPVDEMMLRILASTGTPNYNHPTYDVMPEQMGLGIPWGMIDETSFALLGSAVPGEDAWVLYIDKPTEFLSRFEPNMQVKNLHAFFHRGKLKITGFGEDPSATLQLSEDTKVQSVRDGEAMAPVIQIASVARTTDFLINQISLRYNIPLGAESGREASTLTINNTASQTDRDEVAPVTVDAIGWFDDFGGLGSTGFRDAWAAGPAATALAYFGKPLGVVEITYGIGLRFELYPGRQVLLSDDHIMNPVTGVRGVEDLPCWVIITAFDDETHVGEGTLIFNPELAT